MANIILVPRVKTKAATIESPISRCGDYWWRDIRIRNPYKGIDAAHRTLPSLGDPDQVESLDPDFLDEIAIDHNRIAEFISRNSAALTDSQRIGIELLMRRATIYLSDSKKIQKLWSSGFSTSSRASVPSWPLHGHPNGPINSNIEEGHRRDSDKWKKLVYSALKNLRCAEELVKKASIYEYNKERRIYGRRFGTNPPPAMFAPTPKKLLTPSLDTGTILGDPLTPSLDPLTPSLDPLTPSLDPLTPSLDPLTPSPGEPPTHFGEYDHESTDHATRSRKKDNTLLLAGIAAFSALAFSKGKR